MPGRSVDPAASPVRDGRSNAVGGLGGDGPGYAVARYLGTMGRCADADGNGAISVGDGVLTLRAAAELPAALACSGE